ncbi:MAG: AraC family transcriptional regulator ligand-binding domain-containing protein [Myxococcales bacterium]|nr:AraC family transcriptional regulator ligand-binding domain-containing protein [Myxococcales bacterium]
MVASRSTEGAATASVALVWPFLALARSAGRDDARWRICAHLGLTEAELADPATRVPVHQLATLLAAALRRSDRDIGLLAALEVDAVHLGLMEEVSRTRGTLRSVLEAGMRYVPLIGDGVRYELEIEGDTATGTLAFDPSLQVQEAAVEFVLAIGLLWARRVTGIEALSPMEIHFTHARPADISRHLDLFRCKLFFDAPITKVVMRAGYLERDLAGSEPVLAGLLEQRAEGLLQQLPGAPDTTTEVRRLLESREALRDATAEQVAARLGQSARTLARRLQAEGTSYRDVLDDVRKQAAQRALTASDRSISDIAERLGFSSAQSFNRAFKRWTGTTAAAYRRQHG